MILWDNGIIILESTTLDLATGNLSFTNTSPELFLVLAGIALVLILALVGIGIWFAPGWRRAAAFRQGQRFLDEGDWQRGIRQFEAMQSSRNLPPQWQERLRLALSECHAAGGRELLQQHEYEKAIASLTKCAQLGKRDPDAARATVVAAMLGELRKRFATVEAAANDAVHSFAAKIHNVDENCPEAFFWQALCCLRDGQPDRAEDLLRKCVGNSSAGSDTSNSVEKSIEPYLYLGTLLLEKGDWKDALRYLSEANRIDANCPAVTTQLARAMLAGGGDPGIAVRALQRALGPKGFPQWSHAPHLFWKEGFPPGKSYISKHAAEISFNCPLWGQDCLALHRQAQVAQGEGYCRLGQFDRAVQIYEKLIHESAPSPDVLCGLGVALAKLEKWDEAFKHLHMAHEMENPKTHRTAGYLALCAAMGKPASPDDKRNNVSWALWLVRGFSRAGDEEWGQLLSCIFAEARACGVAIERDDQIRLCDHLLSVNAVDPRSAEAINHLAATHCDAVRLEYAWLYCRAAVQHDLHQDCEMQLFGSLFQEVQSARRFFAERDWDFDEVELAFLRRAAERRPGKFPAELGPNYPELGASRLRQRVQQMRSAGKNDEAVTAAEVLVKLAPKNFAGIDSLAQLQFEYGNFERAILLLQQWRQLDPGAWLPLARLAVVHQRQGSAAESLHAIRAAMELTAGPLLADLAALGAKLQLSCALSQADTTAVESAAGLNCLRQAKLLLQTSLQNAPQNHKARWCLAGVCLLLDDSELLPELADGLSQIRAAHAKEELFVALCFLASGKPGDAEQHCQVVSKDPVWNAEANFLSGWAAIDSSNPRKALECFQQTAQQPAAPSCGHAQALAGGLAFYLGESNPAIQHWSALTRDSRARWALQQPLAQATFLAAVEELHQQRFAIAAEKLRAAGTAGLRDPRLGPLLNLALFEAGRQEMANPEQAAEFLEQANRIGRPSPQSQYLLALNYKRLKKNAEARAILAKIQPADANVLLQLGVLSFLEGEFAQAEREFATCLKIAPQSLPALHNSLLCRLSSGNLAGCKELLPNLIALNDSANDKRLFSILHALIGAATDKPAEATISGNMDVVDVEDDALASLTDAEEESLLQILQSIPGLDAVFPLFQRLAAARWQSESIKRAYLEIALVRAKELADRCLWREADELLTPLSLELELTTYSVESMPDNATIAFWNLQGCCACMIQDFDRAVRCFTTAVKWAGNDPWLYQNLALTCELRGAAEQAHAHWERYFELLEKHAYVPGDLDYREQLVYAGLNRLADDFNRKEKWSHALGYVQRAHQLRPRDVETLERLFNLYVQVRRPDDARRTLRKMREVRPGDPQFELYELDLHEVRSLEDLEWMLGEISRILGHHPGDMRVEDRALAMVANCIPIIGRKSDQLSEQLSHIVDQVRELPNYQINWPVVHDEMHFLRREFQKLRRLSNKCLALVANEEQRRVIQNLNAHIDSKIDVCISMGG